MPLIPIDGHTQLVGLIGWPVEHSISPAMHNAAFAELGLNWRYVPLPVPPGRIHVALEGLQALGFRGANVTVPHKQEVAQIIARLPGRETLGPEALALDAVNTIAIPHGETKDGRATLRGHNTDMAGFVGALVDGGFQPVGASSVVVGAGGGARAVAFGLARARARTITVLNRSVERAEDLALALSSTQNTALPPSVRALPLTDKILIDTVREADLLVNATPAGMWPNVRVSIWPDDVPVPGHVTVFDLVYNPRPTKLMEQARAGGANALGGLEMLVRQGALALEMWTGEEAPVAVMRQACQRSLERHGSP